MGWKHKIAVPDLFFYFLYKKKIVIYQGLINFQDHSLSLLSSPFLSPHIYTNLSSTGWKQNGSVWSTVESKVQWTRAANHFAALEEYDAPDRRAHLTFSHTWHYLTQSRGHWLAEFCPATLGISWARKVVCADNWRAIPSVILRLSHSCNVAVVGRDRGVQLSAARDCDGVAHRCCTVHVEGRCLTFHGPSCWSSRCRCRSGQCRGRTKHPHGHRLEHVLRWRLAPTKCLEKLLVRNVTACTEPSDKILFCY